ncbi:hypothetical protein C7444_105102 [Sphaerotilus hippei]|uniref:Uncharacterized protein n=1 Tax=Sphaerotilus hippei TaxID=744406 RepID=A0A318H1M8_9BURK|nr:hypothetical protein [Sphaerotilus hippei]PXW97004.1 hypothetical protein C7444_105102 [Sphaerotilus hippei]
MGLLDVLFHLTNLLLPAAGVAALAAGLAKLFWWRELRDQPWHRLAGHAAAGAALVLLLGLVFTGRDGRMSTYGLIVLTVALLLWWSGFGPGRRR